MSTATGPAGGSRDGDVVLEVRNLVKHFPVRGGGVVHAVDGVSFTVRRGEVLGLVGESGSGKSTVAKCITRLIQPTSGDVIINGRDITHCSRRQLRPLRRHFNIVFQDPSSSLNPRMTIGDIIAEPLRLHGVARGRAAQERVSAMLDAVGLRPEFRSRYPHELSGGQRQRVSIARALALEPSLLIADEPTSALDVSVQASVLNLIVELQHRLGFACVFVTHDLAVVDFLATRIAVMYLGNLVEEGGREHILNSPKHPYTQALLSAAPVPDPAEQRRRRHVNVSGDLPSPVHPPSGCRFHTRCPFADDLTRTVVPDLRVIGPDHRVACHKVADDGTAPDMLAASAAGAAR